MRHFLKCLIPSSFWYSLPGRISGDAIIITRPKAPIYFITLSFTELYFIDWFSRETINNPGIGNP